MSPVEERRVQPRRVCLLLAYCIVAAAALALPMAQLVPIDALEVPGEPRVLELVASRSESLRFQIAVALVACALGLLALRSWRTAGLALVLAAWAGLPTLPTSSAERPPLAGGATLRLLSVNLGHGRAEVERVLETVRAARADVVVFQEYTSLSSAALAARLAPAFPERYEAPREDNFGMAVFARKPFAGIEELSLADTGTPQLRIELALGDELVVVWAVHLLPPSWSNYVEHRAELVDLMLRLQSEQHLCALIGDFNFVDHGPLAKALHARGFLDAHTLAGEGRGATWPVIGWQRWVPGIRLDHVYVGPGLTASESWLGGATGSDHLPIGAQLARSGP